ncbi:MAG: hypothetical protein ACKOJF_00470, partial [Planctomycetaceae bacterium]
LWLGEQDLIPKPDRLPCQHAIARWVFVVFGNLQWHTFWLDDPSPTELGTESSTAVVQAVSDIASLVRRRTDRMIGRRAANPPILRHRPSGLRET